MSLIETEALILKTYSLAEADKIVVLFTPKQGLVRGVAKGAKRLKSRFGGSLEIFSLVQVSFFQKEERELVSIRQIELQKSVFSQAGNLQFLQKISYLSELLVEFAPPGEPNERLYRMSLVCLETAADNLEQLNAIVLYFEIWLLKLSGYLPAWSFCGECRRDFEARETSELMMNFQLICQNCRKTKSGFSISSEMRAIYSKAQVSSPEKFIQFLAGQDEDVTQVSGILKKIISHVLGKESISDKNFTATV